MKRRTLLGTLVAVVLIGVVGAAPPGVAAPGAGDSAVTEPTMSPAVSAASAPAGARTFQVTANGHSYFSYSLAPSSIATFTWQPNSSSVSAWETETSGGSLVEKMLPQANLTFGTSNSSLPTVTVDPSTKMQTISGFGVAMTQSSASLITGSSYESEVMNDLFGISGAHFNIARVPMGASDFVTGRLYQGDQSYSYDDNRGRPDPSLANFSIGTQSRTAPACAPVSFSAEYGTGDYAATIPALQCAKSINPNLNLLAVPWSAPGWMKIDDPTVPSITKCSGSDDFLKSSDYSTYASYFVKFIKRYESAKLPISEISMQNEPENCKPGYPTMEMSPTDQASFAPVLENAVRTASLSTVPKIMAYDHNYVDETDLPWGAPPNQITDYPETVIADSGGTGSPVGMVGFHHYIQSGPVGLQEEQRALDNEYKAYPKVPIWMTEATGQSGSSTAADNLVWEGQHDLMEPLQNWTSASMYLNPALNKSGGPKRPGGCGNCRGMITLNPGQAPLPNEDYYDWAQFSKFVEPTAVHICSNTVTLPSTVNPCSMSKPGAPTNGDNMIDTVAFQNADGSIVLVAMNTAPDVPLKVVNGYLPSATPGMPYNVELEAAGGTAPYQWSIPSGSLPPGLTFSGSAGTIVGFVPNGTPTQNRPVAIRVTDAFGATAVTYLGVSVSSFHADDIPMPTNARPANPSATVTDLSCPEEGFCVAVGDYVARVGSNSDVPEAMIATYDGSSWTTSEAPLPPGTTDGSLGSVDCRSKTICIAVGEYNSGSGSSDDGGLIETLANGVWTARPLAQLGNAYLDSVSCPATASCVAVGTDGGFNPALIATESGGSWTEKLAPLPNGWAGAVSNLASVYCSDSGDCTAVGTTSNGAYDSFIDQSTNGIWSSRWAPHSPTTPVDLQGWWLDKVSCSAPRMCQAAGQEDIGFGLCGCYGLLDVENSDGWTASDPMGDTEYDEFSIVNSVSCVSQGCAVYGNVGTGTGQNYAWVQSPNGQSQYLNPPFGGNNGTWYGSTSCISSVACIATSLFNLGPLNGPTGANVPFLMIYEDGIWETLQGPTPSDSAIGNSGAGLSEDACSSSGFCVATGGYVRGDGSQGLFAAVSDSST